MVAALQGATMDSFRPVRIGKRMLAAMLVFQALNTLLLVAVLLRLGGGVQEQPEPQVPILTKAPTLPPLQASPENAELAELYQSILTPLVASYTDLEIDAGKLLPGDAELQAAVSSGSLSSMESQAVLAKLRDCYAQQGLPFPKLPPLGGISPPVPGGGQGAGSEGDTTSKSPQ
jgi:hypothetical protein